MPAGEEHYRARSLLDADIAIIEVCLGTVAHEAEGIFILTDGMIEPGPLTAFMSEDKLQFMVSRAPRRSSAKARHRLLQRQDRAECGGFGLH